MYEISTIDDVQMTCEGVRIISTIKIDMESFPNDFYSFFKVELRPGNNESVRNTHCGSKINTYLSLLGKVCIFSATLQKFPHSITTAI